MESGQSRGTDTKNLLVKLTCKGRMSTATATTTAKLKQATNRVLEKVIPMKLAGQSICDMCMMSTQYVQLFWVQEPANVHCEKP